MKETLRYDVTVIGAGPGGYVAAIRAAQLGKKVALVEKGDRLGGTCLNIGCIPSKALLDVSEEFYRLQHGAAERGIIANDLKLDLERVMAFKNKAVHELTDGLAGIMNAYKNIDVFTARARLLTPESIELSSTGEEKRVIETGHVILATGSVPIELPFLPFNGKTIISSTDALSLERVPAHLIVLGAGAIGLELGSVWARFGSQVTVVELLPNILPGADIRLSKMLRRPLSKQGLTFHLETKATAFTENEAGITLQAVDVQGKQLEISGDVVLVAVGRKAYTDKLGLENVGITPDPRTGKVSVDKKFKTRVDTIYAIGDLIDGPMLAHKAEEEGVAVAEIIAGQPGRVDHEIIPGVVYTWPEVATVGKTEEQVKKEQRPYKTGLFNFKANGRAVCMGDADGFVKVIADQETDTVLGVHILGPWASDLIAEAVTVMEFGGSAEDIARTIHAHPTLSEALKEAAMAVDNWSIHSAPTKR